MNCFKHLSPTIQYRIYVLIIPWLHENVRISGLPNFGT
jgi:hypothetical protein